MAEVVLPEPEVGSIWGLAWVVECCFVDGEVRLQHRVMKWVVECFEQGSMQMVLRRNSVGADKVLCL